MIDLNSLPDNIFPVMPWRAVRPDYSHITDSWVRTELENIDRLAFETDKACAQVRFLLHTQI
jgi:hypothetical protein